MNKEKKSKVLFVDLLRIIACIIVVIIHTRMSFPGDNTTKTRVLLAALTADGVSIFWLIMGMFYFRDISYKDRIKKMITKIVLPIIIMSIIIFFFNDFFLGKESILGSISHSLNDYKVIFKDRILTYTPLDYLGHLWYLYTYIILVLLYPILNKIREYIDTLDYKKVILFFWIIMLINDISLNRIMMFSLHGANAVLASLPFFFTGYILYKNNDKIEDKSIVKYIIIFILSNVIRSLWSYFVLKGDPNCREILKWYSSFGLVASICLYMITRNIMGRIKINEICEKLLQHFSKLTLYIYLIHCNVIYILEAYKINELLYRKVDNNILGLLIYITIVYIISYIISEIILLIINLIKYIQFRNKG